MSKEINDHQGTGVLARTPVDGILIAYGTTVPSDAAEGYGTGCLFMQTDGGDGTSLYVNEGTNASANFNAVDVGA
tara:strand:- start:2626 stop:2850 length:225 start_codon:yes stop_codon:yes gene_type:complete